ncbi:MAG: peptidase M14, partial [Idiomarina sp.]|nr:peptidase M14 [Idiomarina sp.]
FTIRNQFITSLSTIYGAHKNKARFIEFQENTYDRWMEMGDDANFDGYLIGDGSDANRLQGLVDILKQHGVEAYRVEKTIETDGKRYEAGRSYFVPAEQPQFGLIQGMFSTRKSFPDNTFYDVSGWTLPMAFNLDFSQYRGRISLADNAWDEPQRASYPLAADAYAYAFDWNDYLAPGLLQELLENDIHARQSYKPLTVETPDGVKKLSAGSIVVTRAYQQHDWADVQKVLDQAAAERDIAVVSIESGLTPEGIDLGSRNINPVEEPSVMMLTGDGVNLYEAGEAWYYFDRHVGVPLSMVDTDRLSRVDLTKYSHIVLVDGSYYTLGEQEQQKLSQWVNNGGVIIGQQGGAEWLAKNELLRAQWVADEVFEKAFDSSGLSYAERDGFYAKRRVAGAIFNMQVDTSHPLLFGFPRENMPVFKDELNAMEVPESPFISVASYDQEQPLLSGYADERNRDVLKGKSNIVAHRLGGGHVIGFADNVNFRAFFWGTAKLLSNAVYLAPAIEAYAKPIEDKKAADAAAAEAAH